MAVPFSYVVTFGCVLLGLASSAPPDVAKKATVDLGGLLAIACPTASLPEICTGKEAIIDAMCPLILDYTLRLCHTNPTALTGDGIAFSCPKQLVPMQNFTDDSKAVIINLSKNDSCVKDCDGSRRTLCERINYLAGVLKAQTHIEAVPSTKKENDPVETPQAKIPSGGGISSELSEKEKSLLSPEKGVKPMATKTKSELGGTLPKQTESSKTGLKESHEDKGGSGPKQSTKKEGVNPPPAHVEELGVKQSSSKLPDAPAAPEDDGSLGGKPLGLEDEAPQGVAPVDDLAPGMDRPGGPGAAEDDDVDEGDDDDFRVGNNNDNMNLENPPSRPDEGAQQGEDYVQKPLQLASSPDVKPEEAMSQPQGNRLEDIMSRPISNGPFQDAPDSHFFVYFLFFTCVSVMGYIAFHNKNKILALVLEGRRGRHARRRPNSASYRKLDTLEDTMKSHPSRVPTTQVTY